MKKLVLILLAAVGPDETTDSGAKRTSPARLVLILLAVVIFVVLLAARAASKPKVDNTAPIEITPHLVIGGKKIDVELANTPEKRTLGLSDRESLNDEDGMLFTFDKQDTSPAFWMKDMNFSIEIIWINDGKVIQIDKNVPPPEPQTPEAELTLYKPAQPIDYVLEVASGFSEENEIKLGDNVDVSGAIE